MQRLLAFDFEPISHFFFSDWFVYGYCAFIIGVFAYWLIPLRRESRTLHEALDELIGRLPARSQTETGDASQETGEIAEAQEFSRGFETYDRFAREKLGTVWNEFVETLLFPETGSDDPIRNTSEVSQFLNESTVIFPKVRSGLFQSVPNLLTGIGILGTFIGLAAGVSAFDLDETDSGGVSVVLPLLEGAGLAFWTSIVGLVTSMVFLWFERTTERKLQLKLDAFVKRIEDCLHRTTTAGIARDQLQEQKEAVRQLKTFNTDLALRLGEVLDEKVGERLGAQLEKLVQAVGELRADRATDSGQVIAEAIGKFSEALHGRAGSEFDDLARTVASLDRTLSDSSDRMEQTQRGIRDSLEEVVGAVRTTMESGTRQMVTTLGTQLEGLGREATGKVAGTMEGLLKAAASLETAAQRNELTLDGMRKFSEQVEALGEGIARAKRDLHQTAAPLEQAVRSLRDASDRSAGAVQATLGIVASVEQGTENIKTYQAELNTIWEAHQRRFEGIDQGLVKVFEEIDEGLNRYTEKVDQFVRELDRFTGSAIDKLAAATADLSDAVDELGGTMEKSRNARSE